MGRCNNEELLKKIGVSKLNKQTEVSFTVLTDLPDCRKINTKDFVKSAAYTYNRFKKPLNRFECMRDGCINTGTLTLTEAGDAVYKIESDATEFAAGIITFYVAPGDNKSVAITATISDSDTFANADAYDVTITKAFSDGYMPVFIDLTKTPDKTEGNGWTASANGAYLKITADVANVGLSSIFVIESLSDFETNDVVKIGCLSEVGGTIDVEAIEATCLNSGYNDDISSLEYTITGKTATPNYWKLCPLVGKGQEVEGFAPATVRKTVASYISGSETYGRVTIADPYQNECGFWAVQLANECNISDSGLTRLTVPMLINVDEGHYILIENEDGTTDVIVNAEFIGTDLLIAYPQKKDIEQRVGSVHNLNSVRTRMAVPFETTDGVKEIHVFDHVLITSFPESISEDETEFSFTISIQKAPDGSFFKVNKIV